MRTLLVISGGTDRPDSAELERRAEADEAPRATVLDRRLGATLLGEVLPEGTPGWRRRLYRLLPRNVPQVIEAFLLRRRYDALVTWAEAITLPLALLLKLTGSRVPHVAVLSSITQPKKAWFLRAVHSHIGRLLISSRAQTEFAVKRLGIPPEKISTLSWAVDQRFWRPMDVPADLISTSGRELRDYGTLIRALRGLDVRCHIAARLIPWKGDAWVEEVKALEPLPPHVTIGYNETIAEVRSWYARSRFVVLPLLPADYELGSTVILEAMAMGKAVICTRIAGQRDLVQDGVTGLLVPPRDPEALRRAIAELWNDPRRAEEMGREARRQVESRYGLEDWVEGVARVVEECIAEAVPGLQKESA